MEFSIRRLSVLSALLWFALESSAIAAPIGGVMRLWNPSAGTVRFNAVYGATAVTTGTGGARDIQIPANLFSTAGSKSRTFPTFGFVAQNAEIFSTTHGVETFMAGEGAAASGSIFYCPRVTGCTDFNNATAPGGNGLIGIVPKPGGNAYGGTFRLLRHLKAGSGAWFVQNAGAVTVTLTFNANERGITVTPMGGTTNTSNIIWPGGATNFGLFSDVNPPGLVYSGMIAPVVTTPSGMSGGYITSLGVAAGTGTFDPPDGKSTGFKMTTGTVFVSDATPVQGTSMTAGGATVDVPFTSSTAGFDNRDEAGAGNIQLVGGGVAFGGVTGNVFFRNTRLTLAVPEPAMHAALAVGLAGMIGMARIRRRD